MTILITGGAGYIGSHTILEVYEKTSWKVVSADNYINSSPDTYDRIKNISGKSPKIYDIDLCDLDKTKRIFDEQKIDGVIHFAALKSVPESVNKPLHYLKNNLNSLINLLDCCETYGVAHFIFSSSCSVYGNTNQLPVDESTPLEKAESPYALTKQMGEQIINEHIRSCDRTKFISLRYFNPVGAHVSGQNGELPLQIPNNLVPYITQTAAGIREKLTIYGNDYPTRDGTCIRDYIHVSDIANAHILALDRLSSKSSAEAHEIYNLGTGKGVSVLEAVKSFEKSNNLKLNYDLGPRRQGDVAEIFADNSLARNKLNWEAVRTLEEMMQSAWLWQKELLKEGEMA